jgi:FAD/FMN-containing dehydrogenase
MTATNTALARLRTLFPNAPNKVVTPASDEQYQAAVTVPWSQTCWTPAAGYVYLSTVEELTAALAIIRETGAKFAIRTTGHNPNAGFSSGDETAIVLDIGQLNSKEFITADGEGDQGAIARVGLGNTSRDVYGWLEGLGLSAIGGRDPEAGLGGFLLGGLCLFLFFF